MACSCPVAARTVYGRSLFVRLGASGAPPLLSLDLLFPGSLVLHSEFLDEAQLCSLYFSFFFPILYIIKVSFSILFFPSFLFGSQKTEETIFIKNLIKNSKEVVWQGGHGGKKVAFHSGEILLCVKGAVPL